MRCGCGFTPTRPPPLVFHGPIILEQSSRSLLHARHFSQGSLSFLLRSLVFGLMILLRHRGGLTIRCLVCKAIRTRRDSFSHLQSLAHLRRLFEFAPKLSPTSRLPHLFCLHFHLPHIILVTPIPLILIPFFFSFPLPISFFQSLSLSLTPFLSPLIDIWG